ncbi:hypothetical protein D4A47_07975 [Anaerotruncus massiliensis (ex Liu et al. 2021)]|uniref:Amidohydrolase 3 domain-containing protein n=2 Tax=Anaerotruncus TaxID=244127 RepID=A0A498CME8_9FIRM|nr:MULTISPECIES: amidohydrolase family protein [Anaerotruncus]MBC3938864.1 amidohydrolase family protein [Anaerotruncus massiliensis (ex Togo et al. 2019)]RLL10820.1 hypothetical protein D4A47_07975 [Anaerotruncus massiliensis (ex Liu et al. 2021)]
MVDVLIKNAFVVDGSGRPGFRADVAIKGDTITGVGDLRHLGAKRTIDAEGLVLSPGFIDAHAHSDFAIIHNPPSHSQVAQGVTTEVSCNCGKSPFPVLPNPLPLKNIADTVWTTPKDYWKSAAHYFELLKTQGIGINTFPLVGHNSVRAKVLGMDNRPCTDDELRQMKELVVEAMELGVPGFSSGLTYTPGMGATNEEIVALAQVVSEYGGIYTTHMSNYSGAGIEKAMDFAVETAWKSGMRLQFSHVAPHGEELYGKGQWLSDLIGGYRARGVDCYADVPSYPTIGVWWGPRAIFPGWLYNWKKPWPQQIREIQDAIRDPEQNARIREHIAKVIAGDKTSFLGQFFTFHNWDSIFLFECRPDSPYHKYVGQSVQQIADAEGMDGTDLYFDLCLREGEALSTVNILEKEEDRKAFFQSPWTMFGSDIYAIDAEHPDACFSRFQIHPRNFGHAIYVIETIVQKNRWLTLEQAIHKMSGLTASHFNMHDRGFIRSGYKADITVFSLENLHERATFLHPIAYPTGIEHVFVNGVETFANGRMTGDLGGVALLNKPH